MKYLIIYVHPNQASFNHAILKIVHAKLANKGHEIHVRDLYAQKFDPLLKADDFEQFMQGKVPEDIKKEQDEIAWADTLVLIFPIWWFQMPAILKGYIDRVFSKGFAYDITETGLTGLLQSKKCIIINTTGGPEDSYKQMGFGQSINTIIEDGNFKFCGFNVVLHKYLYGVPYISKEERVKMLEDLKSMDFPK